MSDKTGIEWTDATWNPLRGCSRVSEGCRHCYAEGVANRFKGPGQPYEGLIAKGGQWSGQITLVPEKLRDPLNWKKPRRIFVNSMSDLFHENVPFEYIDKVFAVMAMAHWHTFQVLTKRPARMSAYFASFNDADAWNRGWSTCAYFNADTADVQRIAMTPKGLPNVWLGVSVEDQDTAEQRIPWLLQVPAAVRWISAEPLLSELDLTRIDMLPGMPHDDLLCHLNTLTGVIAGPDDVINKIDWVVAGGESGKEARKMEADWARSLRDQCLVTGTPFLFKQWGEWAPNWLNDDQGQKIAGSERMDRMGKRIAGRMLDGLLHDAYPETQP